MIEGQDPARFVLLISEFAMLQTAAQPNDILRKYDFFESNVGRIVHEPKEQLFELVIFDALLLNGGRIDERTFLRLLFTGVHDFSRDGLISNRFPVDTPLRQIGAPDDPWLTVDKLEVRGTEKDQRCSACITDVGYIAFRFQEMLWDSRSGRWIKDRDIMVDADSGGKFDFYDPFPD